MYVSAWGIFPLATLSAQSRPKTLKKYSKDFSTRTRNIFYDSNSLFVPASYPHLLTNGFCGQFHKVEFYVKRTVNEKSLHVIENTCNAGLCLCSKFFSEVSINYHLHLQTVRWNQLKSCSTKFWSKSAKNPKINTD